MHSAADVLRFYARVVGEGHDPGLTFDVRKDGPVARAPFEERAPTANRPQALGDMVLGPRRWQKVVALHAEEQPGRVGQLWLAGRGSLLGERRRVCAPLLQLQVDGLRDRPLGVPYEPSPLADALGLDDEVLRRAAATTPAVSEISPQLLGSMPRLEALVAALRQRSVLPTRIGLVDPQDVADGDELWLCLSTTLHVDLAPLGPPAAQRLRAWADRPVEGTALAAHHAETEEVPAPTAVAPAQPRSPLPLTVAQRQAVLRARSAQVTVVSGAPGTGKSHASVAIALDTVARGGSVLLATRSANAADVLAGLLDRHPGPTPVRIGGGTTRRELADRLAAGLPPRASRGDVASARDAEDEAAAAVVAAHGDLARLLAVAGAEEGPDAAREALLRTEVPGAFTTDQFGPVLDLLGRAAIDEEASWWRRWRAARSASQLRQTLGAAGDVPLDRIATAIELGRRRRLAAAVEAAGGLDLGPTRERLAAAEERLRAAVGHRLEVETTGASDGDGRRAVAGLAAALRAGPKRRAEQLRRLDAAALTRTMPLWVGTVTEIEQLLPATPGMFDLVVLDEASQLDQMVAAPVLARARQAVVTGDPRQLRHVSFVADADVDAALTESGITERADQLDVRRVSAFDAAAAVAPVQWLDEHLRSVPHLIRFSADRFYEEHLHVVTTHPSVATADAIDTVHVDAAGAAGDVVEAEVDAVLAELDRLAQGDAPGSVGVVTPFRAQADALESAIIERYDLATIERLHLRVGTVHGFQGGERDTVVLSLGCTEAHPPQRRSFAQDPHLCNVMVTRARRRMVVVTALPSSTGGLLGEYLRHAETPPGPPPARPPADRWTVRLLDELRRQGYEAAPGADRRHGVDLVVGSGAAAVGLLTRPHPDGVDADIARHTALVRAGWNVVEAYATAVDDDVVRTVLDLRPRLTEVVPPAR